MWLTGGRDGVGVEACDRGWTLQWMRPAGLHIVLQAAWLERSWLSRSTANLTNGGVSVGRQIAARHGCPRIRFELVVWPCHGALLPRIKPSAERLAPQASSPRPQCLHVYPVSMCEGGETSGRGLRRANVVLGKLVLLGGSLRVISTSRHRNERTGVCTIHPPHMSPGQHTVARRGAGCVTRDMKSR